MSFVKKIYKLDKLFVRKSWSALQLSNSTAARNSSSVSDSSCLANKLSTLKISSSGKWLTGIQSTRQLQTVAFTYHAQQLLWVRTQVLGVSDRYSNSIMTPLPEKKDLQLTGVQEVLDKQWISMSVQEVLENFEFLSYCAKENEESINDPKYQGVLEVLTSKIPEFSIKDLQLLLKLFEFWQMDAKEPNFQLLFKTLDKECLKRRHDWSVEEIFLMNDLFFNVRLNRISDFTWKTLNKFGYKPQTLTPANLVQLAFLMKVNRKIKSPLYNIEYYFEQNFDYFTIDELGIFAMAFTKYDTTVKSKDFLIKIMHKLTKEFDTVNDITLVALLKIFRFINLPDYREEIEKLISLLESNVDKKNTFVGVEIAFWLKEIRYEQKELYSKLLKRFETEMPNMSMTLIEKVLYTLFSFNYTPKETPLFSMAINELLKPERATGIQRSSKSFVKIVLSALHSQYYSEDALKIIMDPEYRKNNFSDVNVKFVDYLSLDYLLEIEHPEYDGPRLDKDHIKLLHKRFGGLSNYVKRKNRKLVMRWSVLKDVVSTCQQICGSESAVHEDHLLPHLALPDFVLCYDPETKQYLSPVEKLSQMPKNEIKYAPKDGKDWYSIVIATDLVFFNNTRNMTGLLSMRLRLLERIGYKPIVIPMNEWSLLKDEAERLEYMRKILDKKKM